MLAGVGKAGDYAGDPLQTIQTGLMWWNNQAQTQLFVQWQAGSDIDLAGTDHAIIYVDGVIVNRDHRLSTTVNVTAGHVPQIAVVFVPANVDDDNAYDPLYSETQSNITMFFLLGITFYAVDLDGNPECDALDDNAVAVALDDNPECDALDDNAVAVALDDNALVEALP